MIIDDQTEYNLLTSFYSSTGAGSLWVSLIKKEIKLLQSFEMNLFIYLKQIGLQTIGVPMNWKWVDGSSYTWSAATHTKDWFVYFCFKNVFYLN